MRINMAIWVALCALSTQAQQITVYADANYAGASLVVSANTAWVGDAWNDRISSMRIPPGVSVQVFWDANYMGKTRTFTSDVPFVGEEWNDRISSIRITQLAKPSVAMGSSPFSRTQNHTANASGSIPNGPQGTMYFRYTDQIQCSGDLASQLRPGDKIYVLPGQTVPASEGLSFDANAPKVCGQTFTIASVRGNQVSFTQPLPENMRDRNNSSFSFRVVLIR